MWVVGRGGGGSPRYVSTSETARTMVEANEGGACGGKRPSVRSGEGGKEREGEGERERVGGYIKTGAGACQVLRCTQCISVRHRGTPASRKSKYKRVHRRLLLKRKKGARLQNARSRPCPTGKCWCTLIRSNDRSAYVPYVRSTYPLSLPNPGIN